jgi:ADP-glucose pyrophosphorylase
VLLSLSGGGFFPPIYNFCTLLCIWVFIIQESEDQLKEHLIQQQNFLRDRGKKFFRILSMIEKKIISTGIPQLTSKEMSANHKILSLYLSDYFYLQY